jgi:6-phosphogluconolactonase (cycloisomerase 2 family)
MLNTKSIALIALVALSFFFIRCSSSNSHTGTSGTGTTGTTGSPGAPGGQSSVPGYGEGTGAAGQTAAARLLYASVAPSGAPSGFTLQSSGMLSAAGGGKVNSGGAQTMAIDPSGALLYETAVTAPQTAAPTIPGGVWAFVIDPTTGSLTTVSGSPYLPDANFYSDVIDQRGKFLYAQSDSGIHAFNIQSGTGELTEISGSPFSVSGPFVISALQPANRMVVDQTNHFLYASTNTGIASFNIDQSSGALTAISGSPFATDVTHPAAIVITPNNQYLYETRTADGNNFANDGNIYGYTVDLSSGALTPLAGSPFPVAQCPSPGVNVPGHGGVPDNMTIASAGKYLYLANCGAFSIDGTTGALTAVPNVLPGDWPVIDPTGDFLWAIVLQSNCQSCNVGVGAFQGDANTGNLTLVPNSVVNLTNQQFGNVESLAITK